MDADLGFWGVIDLIMNNLSNGLELEGWPPLGRVLVRLSGFATYGAKQIDADDECLICHETYFPSNPDGCHPVKLKPCGHVIGYECFEKWATQGTSTCCLCRRPCIDTLPAPLRLLKSLVDCRWYKFMDLWATFFCWCLWALTLLDGKDQLFEGQLNWETAAACASRVLFPYMFSWAVKNVVEYAHFWFSKSHICSQLPLSLPPWVVRLWAQIWWFVGIHTGLFLIISVALMVAALYYRKELARKRALKPSFNAAS